LILIGSNQPVTIVVLLAKLAASKLVFFLRLVKIRG